jgi:hypothetical protein
MRSTVLSVAGEELGRDSVYVKRDGHGLKNSTAALFVTVYL